MGTKSIKALDKPIIFVHLEKTAGTAFQSYLGNQLSSADAIAPVFEGGDIAKFFGDMSRKLYFGHFSYADCARFGANGHYITILRSPLRRAFSQYSSWHNPKNLTPFWRKTLLKREIEAVEAVQRMSFQDFVMSDDIYVNGHIRNLMSKRLAHDSSWSDSSLGTAFEVLESKFYWFGVVEEFERSIELFRASFTGCDRYQVPIEAANVSEMYDDTLDNRAKQRLFEFNRYDLLLYDKAVEIFHKRYKAMRIASLT